MQKIYLCSFGDMRLGISSYRFYQNALKLGVFDEIFIYNESNLSLDFRQKMNKHIYINGGVRA